MTQLKLVLNEIYAENEIGCIFQNSLRFPKCQRFVYFSARHLCIILKIFLSVLSKFLILKNDIVLQISIILGDWQYLYICRILFWWYLHWSASIIPKLWIRHKKNRQWVGACVHSMLGVFLVQTADFHPGPRQFADKGWRLGRCGWSRKAFSCTESFFQLIDTYQP